MAATDHTRAMLGWWCDVGIARADLAVRRADGAMIWQRNRLVEELPLPWARAENAAGADIYVRPARGSLWPFVFLDDVGEPMALAITRKYRALAVQTSPAGGFHVWLATTRPLDEVRRRDAQRWLADRVHADPASTSGEHLGRLAGFRNWKRAGVWVNVVADSRSCPSWIPNVPDPCHRARPRRLRTTSAIGRSSDSELEWAHVCTALEAGCPTETVYAWLLDRSRPRRGADAERYARRTVERACSHVRRSRRP